MFYNISPPPPIKKTTKKQNTIKPLIEFYLVELSATPPPQKKTN